MLCPVQSPHYRSPAAWMREILYINYAANPNKRSRKYCLHSFGFNAGWKVKGVFPAKHREDELYDDGFPAF
jgi:hypothetical protein